MDNLRQTRCARCPAKLRVSDVGFCSAKCYLAHLKTITATYRCGATAQRMFYALQECFCSDRIQGVSMYPGELHVYGEVKCFPETSKIGRVLRRLRRLPPNLRGEVRKAILAYSGCCDPSLFMLPAIKYLLKSKFDISSFVLVCLHWIAKVSRMFEVTVEVKNKRLQIVSIIFIRSGAADSFTKNHLLRSKSIPLVVEHP